MRICFIVDGKTEYHCLFKLLENSGTPHKLIFPPFYCDMQPYSSIKQIAYRVVKKIEMVRPKNPELVVILIDLEERDICPPDFSLELQKEIEKRLPKIGFQTSVIIKVRKFENWLIADLDAVRSLNQFNITQKIRNLIEPNKADNVDAINLLKRMGDGSYDKTEDGRKISQKITPQIIAKHSRSFRRCLRVIGVLQFNKQSKKPIKNY